MHTATNGTGHEEGVEIIRVETSAAAALNKSEVESQLAAAHQWPRSIAKFQKDAISLATLTEAVAQSCIYAVPRDGKTVAGPSVRLAEICMSAYGNMHAGARILDAEDRMIVAQGVAWDIEKNLRVAIEVKRRITNRRGQRFGDDMIAVTGSAAASIALRNAVFRVIPRALVDVIYDRVRLAAVGDAKTLVTKRLEVVDRLQKIGVPPARIYARIGKRGIEDVGLEELEVLIGLGTAIKSREQGIDEAFPPIDDTADKARNLEATLSGKTPPTPPKSGPRIPPIDDTAEKARNLEATLSGKTPPTPPKSGPRIDEATGEVLGDEP